jgi:hypothetical protein
MAAAAAEAQTSAAPGAAPSGSAPSGSPAEASTEGVGLGPVASPQAPVELAARRAARDALLLKPLASVVESMYGGTTGETPFAIAAVTSALAVGQSTTATRAGRTRDVSRAPSADHEQPPPMPAGEGGGSGGGAAAGGAGGSASSAASMLVAPLLHTAPGAVRLLSVSQPSWRTSFFVLIPERPD